jgi:hypothetical protein
VPQSTVSLAGQALEGGQEEGMWTCAKTCVVTAAGLKYFAGLTGGQVTLREPLRLEVVQVTGIADAPLGVGLKEVHFQWRPVGLSDVVARYIGQRGSANAVAVLRLFDNGWRVVQTGVNLIPRQPFQYSEETSRRISKAEFDRKNRFSVSRSTTKLIGTYEFIGAERQLSPSEKGRPYKVAVSDVGVNIEIMGTSNVGTGTQQGTTRNLYAAFGNCAEPRREPGVQILCLTTDPPNTVMTLSAVPTDAAKGTQVSHALLRAYADWWDRYYDVGLDRVSGTLIERKTKRRPIVSYAAVEKAKQEKSPSFRTPPSTGWPGLGIDSWWLGTQGQARMELRVVSPVGAVVSYGGVDETLLIELAEDGEITLTGVAHTGDVGFSLDTFKGRLSADSRSIAGTWRDARGSTGKWSVILVD